MSFIWGLPAPPPQNKRGGGDSDSLSHDAMLTKRDRERQRQTEREGGRESKRGKPRKREREKSKIWGDVWGWSEGHT